MSDVQGAKRVSRFRRPYRELSKAENQLLYSLTAQAEQLEQVILRADDSRECRLALAKLEEAVMWAVKGITA